VTIRDAAVEVAARLREAGVPFLFVGSFSSNLYGIPRSTKDVDVVIQTPGGGIADMAVVLGDQFVPVDQFRFETNTGTICQEFAIRGSTFRVEMFTLSDDPHDAHRFARRVERPFGESTAFFPTAEDVIVWKLRWARPKDLEDIKSVILVQEQEHPLDWPYIHDWCAKHGTTARLEEILASLPKRGR
jgi:hypothetical protein